MPIEGLAVSENVERTRILLIEDDLADARIVRELLRDADASIELVHVTRIDESMVHLQDPSIDAVLLDMHLPDLSELHAVAAVHAGSLAQPILVLTGRSETDLAVEAIRLGAQDYLIKDDLRSTILVRAISHAIERQRLLKCMRDSVRASHASEEDLKRLLLEGTEALLIVGEGGRVEFANHLAEALMGRSASELAHRPFDTGAAPGTELELEIVRPDGSKALVEVRSVNVVWRERPALLVSLRDVSERRRATEQQLRYDLLTSFLGHMSHELRTPLSAMFQFVSNVRDGVMGPVSEPQAEHLGAALRNLDDVLKMVSNLLEVARFQGDKLRIEPRVMQLGTEIESRCEVLANAARTSGVRFDLKLPAGLPPLLADPARVRQIVTNLVENAIKFTPSGGQVSVSAHSEPGSAWVVLRVRDTGCGVPADHLNRIFDQLHQVPGTPYQTRQGLGLGLYITRELVLSLGGEVRVQSEPGKGTQFEIALPVFTWAALTAPLDEEHSGSTPWVALVAAMRWTEADVNEPIPQSSLDHMRSMIERHLTGYPHVHVPPIQVGEEIRMGAILRADVGSDFRVQGALTTQVASEDRVSGDQLDRRLTWTTLSESNVPGSTAPLPDVLDRCFRNPREGGVACPSPAVESRRPSRVRVRPRRSGSSSSKTTRTSAVRSRNV